MVLRCAVRAGRCLELLLECIHSRKCLVTLHRCSVCAAQGRLEGVVVLCYQTGLLLHLLLRMLQFLLSAKIENVFHKNSQSTHLQGSNEGLQTLLLHPDLLLPALMLASQCLHLCVRCCSRLFGCLCPCLQSLEATLQPGYLSRWVCQHSLFVAHYLSPLGLLPKHWHAAAPVSQLPVPLRTVHVALLHDWLLTTRRALSTMRR